MNASLRKAQIKTEILCLGLRPTTEIDRGRRGGAGPAGGRYILAANDLCVNAPMQGSFVDVSPLELAERDGEWVITKEDKTYTKAQFVPRPRFYDKSTLNGTPVWKIALLHGRDCLASTVYQRCIHWARGNACKFCGIELSLKYGSTIEVKTRSHLRDAAQAALEDGVIRHATLTVGTTETPDKGALLLAEAVRGIRDVSEIPIHTQLEPVERKYLEVLRDSGANTVGIHAESFDPRILAKVCPAKPKVEAFLGAWRTAVDLFGEKQVNSYIIAGLGESDESIAYGAKTLSEMGVIPYLVPLRPILGTQMESLAPPSPTRMARLYKQTVTVMRDQGVDPAKNMAGCVRCGACSALGEFYESLPR
jgi:radical SAM protein (TIGR04043 family)